ncbi:hypothetical protein [Poritiphilus flavus]|uniref:Response regulatory domain-containing protein n=1 Tax=Poritiphilus flavus TaxID=2697053 RepID=A0A6L9ECJ6_9FLAO|nr:hypothetical protein [Poritiphilus flavus]NAS12258.1 hypothetical protein [Poritiphilus flavus]
MASQEQKERVLFYDRMKAHGAYGKKLFRSQRDFEVVFPGTPAIEAKFDYLMSENISTVVFFVYSKEGLYELLPFLHKGVHIILCTSNAEISWLQNSYPEIIMLDIDVPKRELFSRIEAEISRIQRRNLKYA